MLNVGEMASSSRRQWSTSPPTNSELYWLATMANVRRWPIWRGRDGRAVDMRDGESSRSAARRNYVIAPRQDVEIRNPNIEIRNKSERSERGENRKVRLRG